MATDGPPAGGGKRVGKRVMWSVYLDPDQAESLRALAAATRVPAAELVRQGVAMVLAARAGEGRKAG